MKLFLALTTLVIGSQANTPPLTQTFSATNLDHAVDPSHMETRSPAGGGSTLAEAQVKYRRALISAVDAATREWISTVTSGSPEAPFYTTNLYAEDAVLWGTVSEDIRTGSSEVRQYMEYFARLPGLTCSGYEPTIRLINNDIAISSGSYIFEYQKNGETHVVPARCACLLPPPSSAPLITPLRSRGSHTSVLAAWGSYLHL